MSEHRVFVCDGIADEVEIKQAIAWVAEDPEIRTATIEGTGDGTTNLVSFRARVEFCKEVQSSQ